jgi:hypothetical protein
MDSWSRPSKSQATPAPYYLRPGGSDTPYCKTCGRSIGTRKTTEAASSATSVKYCSSRCRSQKPGELDRRIESAFVKFLTGEEQVPPGGKTEKKGGGGGLKKSKGDPRVLVPCDAVERYVFRHVSEQREAGEPAEREADPDEGVDSSRSSDDAGGNTPISENANAHPLDTGSQDVDGHRLAALAVRSGTRVRPPQDVSEVNGSVGGEKGRAEREGETSEMLEKRIEGQKRVKEKEMVRCAARRGVVFGFAVGDGESRKCEAVMHGKVVEPSFAKGDWSIRWRE